MNIRLPKKNNNKRIVVFLEIRLMVNNCLFGCIIAYVYKSIKFNLSRITFYIWTNFMSFIGIHFNDLIFPFAYNLVTLQFSPNALFKYVHKH